MPDTKTLHEELIDTLDMYREENPELPSYVIVKVLVAIMTKHIYKAIDKLE